ncbi:MAG: hypothetical protein GEV09_25155 [Pseudonocardiaceae bacterium]|nr:hypothetical protein [Pseudonocardiaceae bacterium]
MTTRSEAYADVRTTSSEVQGSDGKTYWVTNHIVQRYAQQGVAGKPKEYLVVWAGDENVADTVASDAQDAENEPGSPPHDPVNTVRNALPGPDFLAVIDVTKGSPAYGKVVNTATVGPLVENEPHHMQYSWRKGDTVFAGGLFSAATYAFDVTDLPTVKLKGVSLPIDTPGGSVPDAFWVLKDRTAYGTYMGGPLLPGPYRYSDGSVRIGNGFAGAPGEVVYFDQNGKVLSESPAATPEGGHAECQNLPMLDNPTCANPHGIQAREDLNTMVTSDFVEPRTLVLDPVGPGDELQSNLFRSTVRTWDISDRNHPKVKSVSYLPDRPGSESKEPVHRESSAAMECTVTNLPGHKGAFAQTMKGGAIFYAPDITVADPQWRQVFDDGTANKHFNPSSDSRGAGTHGGWVQTSPDDRFLYHTMIGRPKGTLGPDDPGTAGGVYVLDISKLVNAGEHPKCNLSVQPEAEGGHGGPDCPTLVGAVGINTNEPGKGPHFGTVDHFRLGADGKYHDTDQPGRLGVFNYFVARSGLDGSHQVFMINLGEDGNVAVDEDFRDEFTNRVGVEFNRKVWPHGPFGNAKPHYGLFVVADKDVE